MSNNDTHRYMLIDHNNSNTIWLRTYKDYIHLCY